MTKILNLNEIYVIVIDALAVLQKLRKDNNFEDLSHIFNADIDFLTASCASVIAVKLLEATTRKLRSKNWFPLLYAVNDTVDINRLTMKDILDHVGTKKTISNILSKRIGKALTNAWG